MNSRSLVVSLTCALALSGLASAVGSRGLGTEASRPVADENADARPDSGVTAYSAATFDLDGSQLVDFGDFGMLMASWGDPAGAADFNGDGMVDGADLGLFFANYGAQVAVDASNDSHDEALPPEDSTTPSAAD